MEIVFATHNKNKLRELRQLLASLPGAEGMTVLSASEVGVGDIPETGVTFEENALIKARAVSALGYIAVADDSGLCVDALDGAPGVMSARWSGGDYEENNKKLLAELRCVPDSERGATFVSVVVCCFPDGRPPIVARGECRGVILHDCRGERGFGYDPLFCLPEYGKTFSELTDSEKNAVSHRGRAMRAFGERFALYL